MSWLFEKRACVSTYLEHVIDVTGVYIGQVNIGAYIDISPAHRRVREDVGGFLGDCPTFYYYTDIRLAL